MKFFPGVDSALELTPTQVTLLQYLELYENISEMQPTDRPPDEIVNDDEKLDRWIVQFKNKREAEILHGNDHGADKHQRVTRFSPQEDEEINE